MPRIANKPVDVFKHIDMRGGDKEQCWPWRGTYGRAGSNGWPIPNFKIGGKSYAAHRVVLSLTDPTFELDNPRDLVRHKCDNKGVIQGKEICCNPHHLEHGTHADNVRDMIDRERVGLPHHVVRYIHKLLNERDDEGKPLFTHAQIAKRYGVSRQTVTAIATGASYGRIAQERKTNYKQQFTDAGRELRERSHSADERGNEETQAVGEGEGDTTED